MCDRKTNYVLNILPDTQIAFFCWRGPIRIEDRKENRRRVIEFCLENGITKVLIDARYQSNRASTMEMYDFGVSSSRLLRGMKVAIVRDQLDTEYKFAEDVAANRGACTRCFLTVEDARRWLEEV